MPRKVHSDEFKRGAVEQVIVQDNIRTRDLGGTASTVEFGDAVARRVAA